VRSSASRGRLGGAVRVRREGHVGTPATPAD
jgi:hypothetical protein